MHFIFVTIFIPDLLTLKISEPYSIKPLTILKVSIRSPRIRLFMARVKVRVVVRVLDSFGVMVRVRVGIIINHKS